MEKYNFIDEKFLKKEVIEKYGVTIFQDERYFKFGVDAICLARFADSFRKKKIFKYVDLCSGSGIVGILYSKFANNCPVEFVEKISLSFELNKFNANFNNLDYLIHNIDLVESSNFLEKYSYDYITINPPYMVKDRGLYTNSGIKNFAKIEQSEDFLEKIFLEVSKLLKDKGELYMVHRVERIVDIFDVCRKYGLEPKTLQFIRNEGAKKSSICLIRFVRNANRFLEILDDFNI